MSVEPEAAALPSPKNPVSSRLAAIIGIVGDVLMAISIVARLIFGTGMIGRTAYGERLYQVGLPDSIANALDFGNASATMHFAMILAVIAIVLGLIAVSRKEPRRLAVVGVVTGLCIIAPVLLLPLLPVAR